MIRNFEDLVAAGRALGPRRIAVAAADDVDVLASMKLARAQGLAEGIYVGDPDRIRALADEVGLELGGDGIVVEPDDAAAAARAVGIVREGGADFLMKGKLKTATLIRAVLDRERGLRAGRLLSQVIVFKVPGIDRLMLMTDAALNIAPTLEQKAALCRNGIRVAHALGIRPCNVVALTALEYVNPEMPATVDAAALAEMSRRGEFEGAHVEGPLALDVPLSRFAAERKHIESPVVENTHLFVAPSIEAANILYRAITYFAGGESGGLVVGARVPLLVLSRAETPEIKINSIALAILLDADARAQAAAESAR